MFFTLLETFDHVDLTWNNAIKIELNTVFSIETHYHFREFAIWD